MDIFGIKDKKFVTVSIAGRVIPPTLFFVRFVLGCVWTFTVSYTFLIFLLIFKSSKTFKF